MTKGEMIEKIVNDGIWFIPALTKNKEVVFCPNPTIRAHCRIDVISGCFNSKGIGTPMINVNDINTCWLKLEDYGITWAFTKEELIDEKIN